MSQVIFDGKGEKYKAIFDRLKLHMNAKSEAAVARGLKISPQALHSFKKQRKFPLELLIKYCLKNQISVDWLLTGKEFASKYTSSSGIPSASTVNEPTPHPSYFSKDIGERIREVRENAGLSEAELAEKIGLDDPAIVKEYENGSLEPDGNELSAIADLLDCDFMWLLEGETYDERFPVLSALERSEVADNMGARIKAIREKRGLKQAELAEELELGDASIISKYENNRLKPNSAHLVEIAMLGGCSIPWVITGKDIKYGKAPIKLGVVGDASFQGDKKLNEILSYLRKNPDTKEAVLKLIRGKKDIAKATEHFKKQS